MKRAAAHWKEIFRAPPPPPGRGKVEPSKRGSSVSPVYGSRDGSSSQLRH